MESKKFKDTLRSLIREEVTSAIKLEFNNILAELGKDTVKPPRLVHNIKVEPKKNRSLSMVTSPIIDSFKPQQADHSGNLVQQLLSETVYDPNFGDENSQMNDNTNVFVKDYSKLLVKIEENKRNG